MNAVGLIRSSVLNHSAQGLVERSGFEVDIVTTGERKRNTLLTMVSRVIIKRQLATPSWISCPPELAILEPVSLQHFPAYQHSGLYQQQHQDE